MNPPRRARLAREVWPDLLAFAAGLAMAWAFAWQTRDLVWTLWLASLVVGYAIILWNILGPLALQWRELSAQRASLAAQAGIGGALFLGALFLVGFFSVHFGGFHFVHSVFLNAFFPVRPDAEAGFPDLELYATVAANYWPFVLAAFVAERGAFKPLVRDEPVPRSELAVPAAPARQVASRMAKPGGDMFAAYRNVIRLHLLIFFFAFASFMKLENFAVYAVVYAVYFFPWSALRRSRAAVA